MTIYFTKSRKDHRKMKRTIKELREMEAKRLHAIKGSTNENARDNYNSSYWAALELSINECKEEKTIMNAFYRLSALSERKCYLDNSQALADGKSWAIRAAEELEQKETRSANRLNAKLANYGLCVYWNGIYPSIGVRHPHGGVSEVIQRWYY